MKPNRKHALWLSLGLALYFGYLAIFTGLLPAARLAANAWQMRDAVSVPATVIEYSADQKIAAVRFAYAVGGVRFEASRVGLADPAAENHYAWQRQWYEQLKDAKEKAQPITAWVNPARPQIAFLDPQINWVVVLYLLPFALFFPIVAWLAGKMAWEIYHSEPNASWQWSWSWPLLETMQDKRPEALVESSHLKDASKQRVELAAWLLVLWCIVAWPLLGGFVSSKNVSGMPPWLIAAFPVGMMILLLRWLMAHRFNRVYQGCRLQIMPSPARRGQPLQVLVHIPASHMQRTHQYALAMVEDQFCFYDTGDERPGKVWQHTEKVHATQRADGSGQLHASFDIPNTPLLDRPGMRSRLSLDIQEPGNALTQTFEIELQ